MGKYNISVLLVEDDRLSLVIYSEFIKKIVNVVYTATDGREGIEIFADKRPDVIITDIMMPGMDGLEMIREIKKIDPKVKVVMISGHSEADYFIRSIDLGVDGYLLKPIDNVRLEGKISELGENIMMAKKVEDMMEELKTLNLELEEKVKERTVRLSNEIKEKEKAELALIKAKEKAEESDHLKGIFLANVSHEIQTPIKAIISFSNLLHAPDQDDKRRLELINIIESNSNVLLNLTNDILEFTRLQSSTVKLFHINFELNLFLEELFPVFETLKRRQNEKDVSLKISLPHKDKPIMINSDPSRLRQVFSNLISNAFKFTHHGYVEYGYKVTEQMGIQFFVKDTGLGISKQYQRKIFERFIQEPKPMSIKKEGTGLGLPITQSLIRMLGGIIWVRSNPGEGSTFFFELPGIVMDGSQANDEGKYIWKDKQVLIIEDEIKDYISLEEILKNRLKIHFLNSPEQAIEFCSSNKNIDICILSWSADHDPELLKNILDIMPDHPVIAMFDEDYKDKERKKVEKSFNGVINKPFDVKEILDLLDKHLG